MRALKKNNFKNIENDKISIDLKADIKKYPSDFKQLNELITSTQENIAQTENKILKNNFFKWLNEDGVGFSEAKDKMIKYAIILPRTVTPKNISELHRKYALEYMCTCNVHYFCEKESILRQVPARKEQHKKVIAAMKFIEDQLNSFGTLPFEDSVTQHVFQMALTSLLQNENRSIFSAGKNHKFIARELFTKRTMEFLFKYCPSNVTVNFVMETALKITDQFFYSRMATDTRKMALKVQKNVAGQTKLLHMTIQEFLETEFID